MLENLRYFFYGALIFQVIFMAIFYFQHQKKAYYLYYSLYILGIFLVMEPKVLFGMRNAFVFLLERPTILVYFLFLDAFLELSVQSRRFRRFMQYLKIGIWSLLLLQLVLTIGNLYSTSAGQWKPVISIMDQLFFFLVYLSAIYTLYETYRLKNRYSRYILVGTALLLCGIIINRFFFRVVDDFPVLIGALLELMCFSAAIGYKTNLMEADRKRAQQQQEEADRLRELDRFKNRFYANITHEFRTPLTIINGLSDQLSEEITGKHQEKIRLIKRNSNRILRLINQILDLSRLEAGGLPINYIQGDVLKYLEYLSESFRPLALNRRINLSFHPHTDRLVMDFDPERCQAIMSNLLTNALKFTPEFGKIIVTTRTVTETDQRNCLEIEVSDSGAGIPADQLPFIFDRFYQGGDAGAYKPEGTGIGLALVRELVDLMGGDIRVESRMGQGSRFILRLPIRNTAEKKVADAIRPSGSISSVEDVTVVNGKAVAAPGAGGQDRPHILLVEDNQQVLDYLRECLQGHYQIRTASNGREGIEIALSEIPDLIVSDIMMPEVDGLELCRTLKSDERTDHIPIILLTAKVEQADKMEGLTLGADAYLPKPFHKEELLIRIAKLIELRSQLQAKYRAGETPAAASEDPFLQKMKAIIETNLHDPDFGVLPLSRAMGRSRVQVYRKLNALTGLSTSEMIRTMRLQQAHKLLISTDLNVSEVAYRVGFRDPAHFSRTFSQYYKQPPSAMKS